jgi:dihydroorotate dehydrogenase (fumarate)
MSVDLSTSYLGLDLAHPVMPSASPLTGDIDHIHALVEAGAPAIVLPSLFEEQIEHNEMAVHHSLGLGAEGFAETPDGFFPQLDDYNTGPQDYLQLIRRAKQEAGIPIIASLNGTTHGGWTLYARILADEGVDALEINTYQVAANVDLSAAQVETGYLSLVEVVKKAIDVPLAVKIGPYFSSTAHMARRLVDAGADALVIFNRFYQPDIDIRDMSVRPNLELSRSAELLLRLRWLAILHGRIRAALAVTGGVEIPADGIKALLAGADAVQMVSSILRHGPAYFGTMREALARWMEWHHLESIGDVRGRVSLLRFPDASAFERANYIRALHSWGK